MRFFDGNTKGTIKDEINNICNTTDSVYSLRRKIGDVDNALDMYFHYASESAPQFTFDDTGNTSAPVETQSLVAGTNAYKISSFTSNVLNILRVSILTDAAEECDLTYEPFESITNFVERYSTDSADRGQPAYWTKFGDYIYISPCPNYAETNGLRCYMNRELAKFTYTTFTTTNASNQIDATAHGLSNGDTVILTTNNTLPNGYSTDTVYYVITSATDSFQVATAGGGSAVTIADDGTGTHKFVQLNITPGIPLIHHPFLARHAAYQFLDAKHPKVAKLREQLAMDKRDIQDYWQSRNRQTKTIIKTKKRLYK